MNDLFLKLQSIPDVLLKLDTDLTNYTTFRLASRGNLLIATSVQALQKVLPLLNQYSQDYLIVGWGANQIFPAVCDQLIIHLDFPFDQNYLSETRDSYELPASLGLNYLTSHAAKFALSGWEVFTGIPASLGGAIYMNAGTNLGEIGRLITEVILVTPDGSLRRESINTKSFSYRRNHFVQKGEVVVGATLIHQGIDLEIPKKIKDYLEYRKKSQPLATKNCGCVFKNPLKELQAGRLIDLMGLKGLTIGGLKVSSKHANFIENSGGSTWDDFESLVNIIKSNMDQFYGIEFELEVKIPYH
jgi:UDP-N-acetylmuramate dehydrogenase